eukprot:CAMPEP_0205936866 /NCGR_PEP_ID=MMETSP1325-20131115/42603_1 /ASSEMBLY_ACC=CAM_ASM_000708 /TAXON_ID=236786 /ORGANISM="Florenciella sp., Strain RCC1007" /LENGTH=70 /DNA_ID=CAMNT_0053307069 /DNA_START=175 /DNA_END=387 /DNA_ORIENTATION=+
MSPPAVVTAAPAMKISTMTDISKRHKARLMMTSTTVPGSPSQLAIRILADTPDNTMPGNIKNSAPRKYVA